MQASGRAARVLSYLLADNEQCKQMLTSQQSPSDAHVASDSQVDVLSHVLGRITALSSDGVDGSNGRVRQFVHVDGRFSCCQLVNVAA